MVTAQIIGRMWRDLSDDLKAPYLRQAAEDKIRYRDAKIAFDAVSCRCPSASALHSFMRERIAVDVCHFIVML